MIVTSHQEGTVIMARLLAQLGFVPWAVDPALRRDGKVYLRLPL